MELRHLLLRRKAMTNLNSIFKKQRHHFADKCLYSQTMVFPIVMYRCESWTIKKAEYWKIDTFKLWCWRRLLRVLWTARRSNQSILKEISPEYSLEGLMLKLKLHTLVTWCKELTRWKRPWCWEREGKRRREQQRMTRLDSITNSIDMNLSKLWKIVEDRRAWLATVHGVAKSWTWLSNWMTTNLEETLIILSADFSAETLQARKEWHDLFKVMKEEKNL